LSIFACVLRETLARRRFVDPRWQHFQIDEFVEFDRGVWHGCVLPQGAQIVMSGEGENGAKNLAILLLAMRRGVR